MDSQSGRDPRREASLEVPSDGELPTHTLLTRRELEVVRLMVAGRRNREIAAILIISENTLEHHLTRLYRKLGCTNRTQAALRAVQLHLLDQGTSAPYE